MFLLHFITYLYCINLIFTILLLVDERADVEVGDGVVFVRDYPIDTEEGST